MERTIVLTPISRRESSEDPRATLGETALTLASRNSFPVVAGRTTGKDSAGLAIGASVALLLGGLTFWSMSGHRTASPAAPPLATPVQFAQSPSRPALPMPSPLVATPPAASAGMHPANVDHAHSPVMVFDESIAPSVRAAAPPVAATSPKAPRNPQGLGDNEAFAARLGDEGVETASATRMADPAHTISQGTMIPAVLETAIDSDLPGYVRAVVSQDVRSFDGSQVLIPRSARLIGQYKSGLAAGQTRAYVLWTRLLRPDGVSVALASPAVDYSGQSGLTGKVDGHFMKRFGSAVLLTMLSGLSAVGGSGTSVVLSSGGTSAASVAAQRDASIPPTIRVPQGQPIRVFTARDLDFSTAGQGDE